MSVAGTGAGAEAEIMVKIGAGAKNSEFQLRNTGRHDLFFMLASSKLTAENVY